MAKKYVITISREFGSMGRTIARKMAEALEINFYDRDLVEKVSKEMELPVPTVSSEEEKANVYFNRSFPLGNATSELQDKIFQTQQDVIRRLAEKESCIIVGRCADYVLRDVENLMRIHVYSPYEHKYDNCVNILSMSEKDAKKMIKTVDRAREAYHMRYAKYFPDDPEHNDVLIDSSFLGVEATAALLVEMAKKKFDL